MRRSQEGVTMAPTKPKRIVYRYNEDVNSDEEEFDEYGEFAVPGRDAIIIRHGRVWKAVRVKRETGSDRISIVRVFLTDQNIY
jgi:hypothetical protein